MELWWNGKGLSVLGLKKRHTRILEKAVTCRRKCVLCDKVVDCCLRLKNVKDLWNNINYKGWFLWAQKGSSTGKCCGWSWDETKNSDCCQLHNEKLFECKCKRNNGNNCCQFFGWNWWHARDSFMELKIKLSDLGLKISLTSRYKKLSLAVDFLNHPLIFQSI